ncbi:hypothetical protein HMPREF1556_00501 [Porphyromonas sp. oral taxon 278 str. W7784]|nr:hypothetical protein HMPREF1556_00501 [Porphyromonas sp. oral taxon 278 str. W7784]
MKGLLPLAPARSTAHFARPPQKGAKKTYGRSHRRPTVGRSDDPQ